ncbi:MAG: hypothetical protein ACR2PL_23295 [Dehalococcoidia bacterium]
MTPMIEEEVGNLPSEVLELARQGIAVARYAMGATVRTLVGKEYSPITIAPKNIP